MNTETINIEIIGSQEQALTSKEEKKLKEYFQKRKTDKQEKVVNKQLESTQII